MQRLEQGFQESMSWLVVIISVCKCVGRRNIVKAAQRLFYSSIKVCHNYNLWPNKCAGILTFASHIFLQPLYMELHWGHDML